MNVFGCSIPVDDINGRRLDVSRGAEQGHRQHVHVAPAGSKGKRDSACRRKKKVRVCSGRSEERYRRINPQISCSGTGHTRSDMEALRAAVSDENRGSAPSPITKARGAVS